jgi:hypothetical protein
MAAYVLNGGKDASASYSASATTAFSDVASGKYYTAGIGYVVSKGLVDGFADGTFRPDNSVTGIQAAKILLGALGYKSEYEGYTGSAWKQNVLTDADDAGLFEGLDSVDLTANLTREAAAQMIWNALQAQTVYYYGNGGTTVTTPDGTKVETAAPTVVVTDVPAATLVNQCFNGVITTDSSTSDDLGRPLVLYKVGTQVVATTAVEPAATYTTTVTSAKVYTDLGLTSGATGTAITLVTNSKAAQVTNGTFTAALGGAATLGGNGKIVEAYKYVDNNGDAAYKLVLIAPSLLKINNIVSSKATATTGAYDTYTITNSTSGTFVVYTSKVAGTETDSLVLSGDIAKNDYVLFYEGHAKGYATAVKTVTGVLSSVSSKGIYTIDGTGYELSFAFTENTNASTWTGTPAAQTYPTASTSTQGFYVDANNYIVGIQAAADVATEYLYVVTANQCTGIENKKQVYTLEADVVFADGTNSTVTVYSADSTVMNTLANTGTGITAGAYSYTVNTDGTYVLTTAPVADKVALSAVALSNTNPAVSSLYANNATKYVFITTDASTGATKGVTTATGYTNITSVASANGVAIKNAQNASLASIVFVVDAQAATNAYDYAYYTGNTTTTVTAAGSTITYEFIVDGETVEIAGVNIATNSVTAGDLVNISNANVASAAIGQTQVSSENITAISYVGGLLKETHTSGPSYVAVGKDVPVYSINTTTNTLTAKNTIEEITEDISGAVYIATDLTGAITAIYVLAA